MLAGALLAALLSVPAAAAAAPSPGREVVVLVRGTGPETVVTSAVEGVGGEVTRPLPVIGGAEARVPADRLGELRRKPGIDAVTPNSQVTLLGGRDDRKGEADEWDADKDLGSLYQVTKGAGVQDAWHKSDSQGRKITGKGVGVALIDSGVTPVSGLDDGGVVNGPDLSFESQSDDLRYLDTFGHGTHMAGIISGRDQAVKDGHEDDPDHFVGVAPDATLLNVKVATADGATDVSQVIAAIDWVVQHRNDPGLNIRVINLSFGTQSTQSYLLDPLAYAVEVAWRKGVVVVVSAGNDGNLTESLTNPAIDPFVIAVGAADHRGTEKRNDDMVADFSSRGSLTRSPDVVAPGRSLVSLRVPGSAIDIDHPTAVVADHNGERRLFRGSGTSQAAAFMSGTVALLLQQRPGLSPDQVKQVLTSTSDPINSTDVRLQGAGLIDVKDAIEAKTPSLLTSIQTEAPATGTGSLEEARGGSHVADPEDGTELVGEQDIFGQTWDGRTWAVASLEGRTWADGVWNGSSWAGRSWAGTVWEGRTWAGRTWAGRTWADNVWDGRTWAGRTWAGRTWAGRTWADNAWDGRTWADASWAGRSWAGRTWAGRTWANSGWSGISWR